MLPVQVKTDTVLKQNQLLSWLSLNAIQKLLLPEEIIFGGTWLQLQALQ